MDNVIDALLDVGWVFRSNLILITKDMSIVAKPINTTETSWVLRNKDEVSIFTTQENPDEYYDIVDRLNMFF